MTVESAEVDVRPRLHSLTGLRFFAAFLVLLRHAVLPLFPIPVLRDLAVVGPVGVGFFFVLSGFLLMYGWRRGEPARFFYGRRFARIYPLHLVTTVVAIGVSAAWGETLWASAIVSLLLLQAWLTDPFRAGGNPPSWSLSCEAFFYALFPGLAPAFGRLRPRNSLRVIAGVLAAMALYTLAYAAVARSGASWASAVSSYTNPVYRLGEFAIGIALAVAMRHGWRPRISLRSALSAAGAYYCALAVGNWAVSQTSFQLGGEDGLPLGVLDLIYLPAVIFLVAAAAANDLDGRASWVGGCRLVVLGEWSFALYLVQSVVVGIGDRLLPDSASTTAGGAVLVLVLCASIGLSGAAYRWIERPVERRLRRRIMRGQLSSARS